MLSKGDIKRFVYFELEADEIYNDFGDSFQLLLAHIIIELAEFTEDQSTEELIEFAESLGLLKASDVIKSVNALSEDVDIEEWEINVLPTIIEDNT